MKKLLVATAACVIAFSPARSAIELTVGTGSDSAYLFIEGFAEPLHYTVLFTHDPFAPLDGFDLWQAVLAGDTLLGAVFVNYGDEVDPNYFINSITYDSVTLENEGAPSFSPWWSQWVSGGESGYPEAEPIAFGIWDFGSGMSDPYRVIVPFATDAYVFGDGSAGPTSAAPIPEPAAFVLLTGALLCLVARRNRTGG